MTTAEIVKYIDTIVNIQGNYKLIEPEKPEIMVVRIVCIAIVLVLPIILCMFVFQVYTDSYINMDCNCHYWFYSGFYWWQFRK